MNSYVRILLHSLVVGIVGAAATVYLRRYINGDISPAVVGVIVGVFTAVRLSRKSGRK